MANFKGKRMVEEDLIKKLEDLDPSSGEYTAGTGIEISSENEISIDTDTVATKSELFSGSYNDLTNKPDLSIYAESSDLATVATTGAYSDLSGTPTLATVATTGAYSDLTGTPTIPAAVSGTNDGTNWTGLTIGSDTYAIPAGGSGSSYTFTDGLTESSGTVSWDLNNLIKKGNNVMIGRGGVTIGDETTLSRNGVSCSEGNLVVGYSPYSSNGLIGTSSTGCIVFGSRLGSGAYKKIISENGGSLVGGYANSGEIINSSLGCICVGYVPDSTSDIKIDTNCAGSQCFGIGTHVTAQNQMIIGKYNNTDASQIFIIGNGTDNNNRSNAMTVSTDGTIVSKNLPAVDTTTDGTYILKATVSSGVVTYAWVLES